MIAPRVPSSITSDLEGIKGSAAATSGRETKKLASARLATACSSRGGDRRQHESEHRPDDASEWEHSDVAAGYASAAACLAESSMLGSVMRLT